MGPAGGSQPGCDLKPRSGAGKRPQPCKQGNAVR